MKTLEWILSTMRNTLYLSLMLGLTWIISALPTSVVQQYISVILNSLTGVYILVFTAFAQKKTSGKPGKKTGGGPQNNTSGKPGKKTSSISEKTLSTEEGKFGKKGNLEIANSLNAKS